jgi:UDPglucose 6-dehydrogenase
VPIIGEGFLADGARAAFGEPSWFDWVLDHPALLPLEDRLTQSIVLISTPLEPGTIAGLEARAILEGVHRTFAYLPENVREAHPEDWGDQARHILGCRAPGVTNVLRGFFYPTPMAVMSPESAEVAKVGINCFLATSVVFAGRIARIASRLGADPYDVARGMMTDPRIGPGAYLRPAGDVGPNLQRELDRLDRLDGQGF